MPSKACEIPKTSELIDNGRVGHSIPKLLEDSHAKIRNESKVAPVEVEGSVHSHIEHLMTDVLDGLQDNINVLKGNSKMVAYFSDLLFFLMLLLDSSLLQNLLQSCRRTDYRLLLKDMHLNWNSELKKVKNSPNQWIADHQLMMRFAITWMC